jgi:hypothetical protein
MRVPLLLAQAGVVWSAWLGSPEGIWGQARRTRLSQPRPPNASVRLLKMGLLEARIGPRETPIGPNHTAVVVRITSPSPGLTVRVSPEAIIAWAGNVGVPAAFAFVAGGDSAIVAAEATREAVPWEIVIGTDTYQPLGPAVRGVIDLRGSRSVEYRFRRGGALLLALVFETTPATLDSVAIAGRTVHVARTRTRLAGSWAGSFAWRGVSGQVLLNVDSNSSEVADLTFRFRCPGRADAETRPDVILERAADPMPISAVDSFTFRFSPSVGEGGGTFVTPDSVVGSFTGTRLGCPGRRGATLRGRWWATRSGAPLRPVRSSAFRSDSVTFEIRDPALYQRRCRAMPRDTLRLEPTPGGAYIRVEGGRVVGVAGRECRWASGLTHEWVGQHGGAGNLILGITSDREEPLRFVVRPHAYMYLSGRGTVRLRDRVVELPISIRLVAQEPEVDTVRCVGPCRPRQPGDSARVARSWLDVTRDSLERGRFESVAAIIRQVLPRLGASEQVPRLVLLAVAQLGLGLERDAVSTLRDALLLDRFLKVDSLSGLSSRLGGALAQARASLPVVAEPWAAVSAGASHTCALTVGGRAFCWGRNDSGQLGDGGTITRSSPVLVLGELRFSQISTATGFTCGLTTDGRAYCWGANSRGQLGSGAIGGAQLSPVPVPGGLSFVGIGTNSGVAADFACGLTSDGVPHCWGRLWRRFEFQATAPRPASGAQRFRSISVGASICGLTEAGAVYCWQEHEPPAPATGGLQFEAIAAGYDRACGHTPAGRAYCWVFPRFGRLADSLLPIPVAGGLTFQALAVGLRHTCGLTTDGRGYCWGANSVSQLGDGTTQDRPSPTPVLGGHTFRSIAGGESHSCGITTEGRIYCWGRNDSGQIGDGTVPGGQRGVPTPVAVGPV